MDGWLFINNFPIIDQSHGVTNQHTTFSWIELQLIHKYDLFPSLGFEYDLLARIFNSGYNMRDIVSLYTFERNYTPHLDERYRLYIFSLVSIVYFGPSLVGGLSFCWKGTGRVYLVLRAEQSLKLMTPWI